MRTLRGLYGPANEVSQSSEAGQGGEADGCLREGIDLSKLKPVPMDGADDMEVVRQ